MLLLHCAHVMILEKNLGSFLSIKRDILQEFAVENVLRYSKISLFFIIGKILFFLLVIA